MDFSPSRPYEMILSASKKGKSDLYLFDTRTERALNLTRDLYDDLNPRFLPNTNQVICLPYFLDMFAYVGTHVRTFVLHMSPHFHYKFAGLFVKYINLC